MTRFQALLAATALTLTAAATPALAAKKEVAAEPAAKALKLSKPVIEKLQAGKKLEDAGDAKGALAVYKEADALPNLTPDERYAIAQYETNGAIKAQDMNTLEQVAVTRLELGREDVATQAKLNQLIASQAYNRQDYPRATKYFEAALALNPNDLQLASNVTALYIRQKQYAPAYALLNRSVAAVKAAGQPVSEETYQRMFGIAYDGKLAAELPDAATALVTAYPTPKNWRNVLLVVRDSTKLDDDGVIDVYRLLRVTGAMTGERDYYEFADTLSRRGLPGEAKAVFDEGVAKGALERNKASTRDLANSFSPERVARDRAGIAGAERDARSGNGKAAMGAGDVNLAYGQFAPAAADYRLALQKGGIDVNTANTRLGIALARSGDKAGAQAALAAVTGPRAPIAHYWVIWLNRAA